MTMHPEGHTLTFRSRIDWWLAALIFGVLGLAAWRVGAAVWRKPTPESWVAASVTVLVLGITIWFFAATAYDVEAETLIVRSSSPGQPGFITALVARNPNIDVRR